MIKTPNQILHIPFEKTINDVSGNNYTGTSTTKVFAVGKFGNGYTTGIADNVINYSNMPFISNSFTACCWINPTTNFDSTFSGVFTISADAFTSNTMIIGGINTGGINKPFFTAYSTGYSVNSLIPNVVIPINTWTFLALSATRSGISNCYVNGVNVGTFTAGSTLPTSPTVYCIGDLRADRGLCFGGIIDNCLLYYKALSQPDIKRVMMGLHPLNG